LIFLHHMECLSLERRFKIAISGKNRTRYRCLIIAMLQPCNSSRHFYKPSFEPNRTLLRGKKFQHFHHVSCYLYKNAIMTLIPDLKSNFLVSRQCPCHYPKSRRGLGVNFEKIHVNIFFSLNNQKRNTRQSAAQLHPPGVGLCEACLCLLRYSR